MTFDIGPTNYVKQIHYLYLLPILKCSHVIGFDMLLVTELQLVENPEIKAFAEKLMSILQIKVRIMMLLSICVT